MRAAAGGLAVAVALAGGAFAWSRAQGSGHPDEWDPRVADLVDFVERERDLRFEHPVAVEFLPEAEFVARFEEEAEEGVDDAEADAAHEDDVAVLRALGLVSGSFPREEVTSGVAAGVVGLYDPAEQHILVRGDELTPLVRATLVHELTHALQDQHHDLAELQDGAETNGAASAVLAVIEGDASVVEQAYVAELPQDEQAELGETESTLAEEASGALPDAYEALVGAPYALGPSLVRLHADASGDGREALFRSPPRSERHLLDPAGSALGELPRDPEEVPTPEVRDGEELLGEEEEPADVGPLTWLLALAPRVGPDAAWEAVQGWAGDAGVAVRRDGRVCIRADVAAEDDAAAQRLGDAFGTWADEAAPGSDASAALEGRTVRVEACDPGPDEPLPGEEAGTLAALLPPVIEAQVVTELVAAGADPEVARCAAETSVADVEDEGWLAEDWEAAVTGVVVDGLPDAIAGCGG